MAVDDSPLLSVVIPSYGRPEILNECISALLDQTYDNMEVVLVHDGPGCPEYDSENIIIDHQDEPRGSPTAKNRGIELASGDIIVFIDDDSVPVSDEWALEYVDVFRRSENDVGAVGGYIDESQPFSTSKGPGRIDRNRVGFYRIVSAFQASEIQEVEHLKSCNFAVLAEVFDKLEEPYFDPRFTRNAHREETDFTLRIREAGYRLLYTPDCRVQHKHAEVGGQRASVSGAIESAYWSGYNESLLFYKHFHDGWVSTLLFFIQELVHNRLMPWHQLFKASGVMHGLIDHRVGASRTSHNST